jgi:hypothetical protein
MDPMGEDLPLLRYQEIAERTPEIQALCDDKVRHSRRLIEQCEDRDLEAVKY